MGTRPEAQRSVSGLSSSEIVRGVRGGEPAAMESLYSMISAWRGKLGRQVGYEHADDALHDLYVAAVAGLRSSVLRDPECLVGYLRTIQVRQMIAGRRESATSKVVDTEVDVSLRYIPDPAPSPEQLLYRREKRDLVERILVGLLPRDREILMRYYLWEQAETEIRAAMGMTSIQYRLFKSRAKHRLGERGKRLLAGRQ